MGEYSWTVYHIGGKLAKEKLAELKEFAADFTEREEPTSGAVLCLQGQLNYGDYDELDDFLQENGLTFHAAWAAVPGAFDSGVRYWKPGMQSIDEAPANDDGEPICPLGALEEAQQQGKTLADVIAEMRPQSSLEVPPLEIVDVPCKGCDNPAPKCAAEPCEFAKAERDDSEDGLPRFRFEVVELRAVRVYYTVEADTEEDARRRAEIGETVEETECADISYSVVDREIDHIIEA